MTTTHVFAVEGMHCASCTLLIDETLEDLPGVGHSRTELKAKRVTVELDPDTTSPEQVADAIAGLGYTATRQP